MAADCPFVKVRGYHLEVLVYSRPLRYMFRKTFSIRCWGCDLYIEDPAPRNLSPSALSDVR